MSCLGSSTKKLIPTVLRLLSRKVLIMLIDRSRGNHDAFKVLFSEILLISLTFILSGSIRAFCAIKWI